ncbi:MBL fold metallo-hydrolase [Ferruginibacter sp.]
MATTKKAVTKKIATKKTASKKSAAKKTVSKKAGSSAGGAINNVKIRMYCLGTGDCFIVKYCHNDAEVFTMMIDCGSCQGTPADFQPYVDHLAKYVKNKVDLLVITHEHNDHVNGFAKCAATFNNFTIGEAWFAWTEDPKDPTGAAKELQTKRSKMKKALGMAINSIKAGNKALADQPQNDYYSRVLQDNNKFFLNGLDTLAEINLSAAEDTGKSLPGMVKIKDILKQKGTKVKYLNPGETVTIAKATGIKFHILGPPMNREYIFKDGKEGVDVFNKKLSLNESALAASAFLNIGSSSVNDLPFTASFVMPEKDNATAQEITVTRDSYNAADASWRKIDNDWLNSAGSLALRLNSHINNTSLAMAIEFDHTKKVLLFPGDAEYGSWESWHDMAKWKPKKAGDKHFVEDLLNRTVFYKVGHHLSYNGTALQKGIMMMEHPDLAAIATLDRHRIAKGWKSTMPNKFLLQELIKRCQGKLFIMDEFEITNGPSKTLDPASLGKKLYETEMLTGKKKPVFIQYNCKI